jgi:hypothetical protein
MGIEQDRGQSCIIARRNRPHIITYALWLQLPIGHTLLHQISRLRFASAHTRYGYQLAKQIDCLAHTIIHPTHRSFILRCCKDSEKKDNIQKKHIHSTLTSKKCSKFAAKKKQVNDEKGKISGATETNRSTDRGRA